MKRMFFAIAIFFLPILSAWSTPIDEPIPIVLPLYDVQAPAVMPNEPPTPIARQSETDITYVIANRPLTIWRRAVDAYQHIDPGRRSI